MLMPSSFNFSQIDQELLSSGTAERLLMACAMGGLIGVEREWRRKPSGVRTNLLLCLGCAFFTLLSGVLAGEGNPDKGRVAANIVQGIGFLGAGLILHARNRVMGLTSAATVFVVASIGMACGAGLYLEAALATGITLVSLQLIGVAESRIGWKRYTMVYEVRGVDQTALQTAVLSVLDAAGERLNIVEKDHVGPFERMVFLVTAERKRQERLLAQLKASSATEHVMVFRDTEEE
jgi:putative Mg2+ transporter-C (MgtC) family protein